MSRAALPVATAFASGLLFGSGLVLSGMTAPANILAFLDVAGAWNPALALVMASAIAVAAPAFARVRRQQRQAGLAPARRGLDRRLVLGSLVFGTGWGLSGICPGPGLVLATAGSGGALVFVAAMAAGMALAARFEPRAAGTGGTAGNPAAAAAAEGGVPATAAAEAAPTPGQCG